MREYVRQEASRVDNIFGLMCNTPCYDDSLSEQKAACKARREASMRSSLCGCSLHPAAAGVPSSAYISANSEAASTAITVTVYSLLWTYDLVIQELKCSNCGAVGTPTPHDALCYASQAGPCQNKSFLFTRELLEYTTRSLVLGSSIQKLASTSRIPEFRVHAFGRAWFEYAKCVHLLDAQALGILGLDGGPFSKCPVCSLVMKDGKHDPVLEAELRFPVCICTDASNTPDRLKCALASEDIPPSTSTFIGDSHRAITGRLASGSLTSSSYSADADGTYGCGPGRDYKAGRQKPTCTSKKGSEGLMGCVCKHVIPLVGAFASLDKTHECYLFYDVVLDAVIAVRPDVTFVYLDFGCRFGRHYRLRDDPGPANEIWQRVRILVPWMHSQGHVIQCRLTDGGMYADGAGFVVGEQTEQLWAVMKSWAASMRFMTPAHRIDFMNMGLACVAQKKADSIFSSLASKEKQMRIELASTDAKMLECLRSFMAANRDPLFITPEAAGGELMRRAAALTEHQIKLAVPAPSGEGVDKLDYVLCRVCYDAVSNIVADGARRVKLLYPRNGFDVQVALDAASATASLLTEKIKPLLHHLGWLAPGGAQLSYSTLAALPTFVAAFSDLRASKTAQLDGDISTAIAKLHDYSLRYNARSITDKLRGKLKGKMTRLENTITVALIPSRLSWTAFDVASGIGTLEVISPERIAQLLAGEVCPGLLSGGESRFTSVDVIFRDAFVRQARTREEIGYNATEKIRARLSFQNLLTQLSSNVQARTESLGQIRASILAAMASGNLTAARASWADYRRVNGELAILNHHLSRVTRVLNSAAARAAGMGLAAGAPSGGEPEAESEHEDDSDPEYIEATDSDTDSEAETE